jgi:DNA-directed RNA polymerase subunit beta'
MVFADLGEVQRALDAEQVELAAKISVRLTEWTRNKESGEFEPTTGLVETTGDGVMGVWHTARP